MASHDLVQVGELCDRTLWLEKGQQRLLGKSQDVLDAYRQRFAEKTRSVTPQRQNSHVAVGHENAYGLILQENRLGTQDLEISEVKFKGGKLNDSRNFESGQPVTVEISYLAKKRLRGLIFGVTISNEQGVPCFDGHSVAADHERIIEARDGKVVLEFLSLDLRPGTYSVSVGAYEQHWEYAYDYHWNAYEICVYAASGERRQRDLPHRWKFDDRSDGLT